MSILYAIATIVPGGSTDQAIAASLDQGLTFTPITTPAGEGYAGGATSLTRGETLFLTGTGVIQRTVDGVTIAPLVNDIGNGSWKFLARDDTIGLYVAVGNDGADTTHRISTSPTGEVWTRRSAPAISYVTVAAYPDVVIAGSNNFGTQPCATAPDGITYALINAFGFTADISGIARDSGGGFMFSSPGDLYSISANSTLTAFAQVAIVGGQLCVAYDPVTDLYATGDPANGVYTSPPVAPAWTLRQAGLHFQNVVSMVPKSGGGFLGLRPIAGSETAFRIVDTSDGVAWTQTAPAGLVNTASYNKLVYLPQPVFTVPDVVGLSIGAATAAITSAGFIVGTIATQETNDAPANSVLSQFPLGGTMASAGTAVSVTIAVPRTNVVPDVIGMTLADAEETIRNAGFQVGAVTVTTEPLGPLGTVVFQSPPGGSVAAPGTKIVMTSTALIVPFDIDTTVISQYTTSPTIMRLVENMEQYVDQRVNITNFYNLVWNVDTAVGFGLDIWGNIVGVSRLIRLPSTDEIFGYINADDPPDWAPFNEGIFTPGTQSSQSYNLPDDAFRTLILTKALSNIVATNAASLNQLLRNLFPGRGKAYVQDLGAMAMRFVFEFSLTSTEYAILTQSGALPHPAGVSFSVVVVPSGDLFGFVEAGGDARPFDFGVFYLPP